MVSVSSINAHGGAAFLSAYSASKAALVNLSKNTAQGLVWDRIRVNCILPGWVDTPMSQREMQELAAASGVTPEQAVERTVQRIALGRMATSAEIASACLFLASDDAAFVTGTALIVDGGLRIPAAARAI